MAPNILPLPDSSVTHVDKETGRVKKDIHNWFKSVQDYLNDPSLVVGEPTGGNKGDGSINAEAIYVNGVAVAADPQLFSNIPQNIENAGYNLIATDAQKHIYKNDASAHTWTLPANASVAYPIGTAITFINLGSAGSITIAITSDTLVLAGSGSTGSRTLAINGMATAVKVETTKWIISGTGLS